MNKNELYDILNSLWDIVYDMKSISLILTDIYTASENGDISESQHYLRLYKMITDELKEETLEVARELDELLTSC